MMKIVDLSHVMNVHTPGWVGYAGNKMYYAQNLQTVRSSRNASTPRCMSARISTAPCTPPTTARATWRICRSTICAIAASWSTSQSTCMTGR